MPKQSLPASRRDVFRIGGLGLIGATLLSSSACGSPPGSKSNADDLFLTIATGGQSGVYYPVGSAMARVFQSELDAKTSVEATGASVDNINLLDKKKAEMAIIQADAASQAYAGYKPFKDKIRSFSAVASLYPQYIQLIALAKSGIKSVEDLKGKRVSVGAPNSGVELNARTVVGAYGLKYKDFKVRNLSYAETVDGMQNGSIDAGFFTSGMPNPSVTQVMQQTKIVAVPISGDGAKKLEDEYDYFQRTEIPAKTYQNPSAVPTLSFANLLVMSNEIDKDTGFELTKKLWANIDKVHDSNSAAKAIKLKTAQDAVPIAFHPGAKRYYSENA